MTQYVFDGHKHTHGQRVARRTAESDCVIRRLALGWTEDAVIRRVGLRIIGLDASLRFQCDQVGSFARYRRPGGVARKSWTRVLLIAPCCTCVCACVALPTLRHMSA